MTTTDHVLAFVADRIGQVYRRPLMYGGDAGGVDLVLWAYHDVWSQVAGRDQFEAHRAVAGQLGCGARGFADHFRIEHPDAPPAEAVAYVVAAWRRADAILGLDPGPAAG